MPTIQFTTHLKRYFPTLENGIQIEGSTVADILAALDQSHPGLADYIMDEHGRLRKHVNIFIGDSLVYDRERLSDAVDSTQTVFIMQALSGG